MTEQRIDHDDLRAFARALLRGGGVDPVQAEAVADNAVWNELVGRHNFGLSRFPVYLDRVAAGGIKTPCAPRLERRGDSIALFDADDGFGQYAGKLAMDAAIAMARRTGVGAVAVRASNFFGTGAYFVQQAADAGMIGLALSNSFPKVVAHGGLTPVFGTNPFAFGAPRACGDSLLVDMATSALAGSTVRQHRDAGQPLPEGMAIDGDGRAITDPDRVEQGALLPFSGPKGSALALLVELLAGVLAGAGVSTGVRSMYRDLAEGGENGHFMMALDIARFMPLEDYYQRCETLIALIRGSGPDGAVLLPGEIRWRHFRDNLANGVALAADTRGKLAPLAAAAGVALPCSRARAPQEATS